MSSKIQKHPALTAKKIRVTLLKSPIGTSQRKRQTLRGLGLKKRHQTVELKNTPPLRGMINRVIQMVRVQVE